MYVYLYICIYGYNHINTPSLPSATLPSATSQHRPLRRMFRPHIAPSPPPPGTGTVPAHRRGTRGAPRPTAACGRPNEASGAHNLVPSRLGR